MIIEQLTLTLIAGFIGTIILTIAQEIDIRLFKRPSSNTPALAFAKIVRLDISKWSEKNQTILTYVIHFMYGTVWAVALIPLMMIGITDFMILALAYSLVVWAQGVVVYKILGLAPWFWTWGLVPNLKELFFKFVLGFATVYAYYFLVLFSIIQLV